MTEEQVADLIEKGLKDDPEYLAGLAAEVERVAQWRRDNGIAV